MRNISERLIAYAAYHRDERNKWTHFFGVPIVMFSIFIPMAWFRFVPLMDWPLSAATIFALGGMIFYLRLDKSLALIQLPFTAALLYAADLVARMPFWTSFQIFVASFVLGWAIQLLGHWFEGRRPALTDNLLQIFMAPLFVTAELLFMLGFRKDLQQQVERA